MRRCGPPNDLLKQTDCDEYGQAAEAEIICGESHRAHVRILIGIVKQTDQTKSASECCRVEKERSNRNHWVAFEDVCTGRRLPRH